MKIQTLFNLLRASQDLLQAFEGVESPAQLVSRLEKLKRADVDNLLDDVDALRDAVDDGLTDTIEMNGYLANTDDNPDSELDGALSAFPELNNLVNETQQDATGNDQTTAQADGKENPDS